MKKPVKPNTTMMRRSANIYRHQLERASGVLPYTLAKLREIILSALSDKVCQYCQRPLTAYNFSADHAKPLARLGSWNILNLRICCMDCNTVKGPMTDEEFHKLVALIDTFPPAIARHLFIRIKAGSKIAKFAVSDKSATNG